MRFCSYCGKKINTNIKFCNYCGKNLNDWNKPETLGKNRNLLLTNHTTLSIFVSIAFILILILLLIFLNQKTKKAQDTSFDIPLSEERLINIEQEVQRIKGIEEKRKEGYSLSEKPFDNRDYSYDERTVDFRLVCKRPCPLPKNILDQEFAAIAYAVSTLRGLTQSDLNKNVLPFEVHASEDSICPYNPEALAYMTIFTDSNDYNRGLLCFFFDKLQYNRDKFPYSTSVHEVTHLFEYGKLKHNSILWEGLSEMMESFFLKGNDKNSFCWKGNNWYGLIVNNPHDPHGTGRQLFFSLCNQYGFDYDDLPELFRQLKIKGGNVDEKEFVKIINSIVGADTSSLFKKAGVI